MCLIKHKISCWNNVKISTFIWYLKNIYIQYWIYIYIHIYSKKKRYDSLQKYLCHLLSENNSKSIGHITNISMIWSDVEIKYFFNTDVKLTPYIGFRQISLDSLTPNQSSNLISENPTTSRLGPQDERKKRGKRK